jgi:activator of 2-hydroxyglutaryl-CoA dehydratase
VDPNGHLTGAIGVAILAKKSKAKKEFFLILQMLILPQ